MMQAKKVIDVDYSKNALEGVTWFSGYCYNRNTGVMEQKANQYVSEKFSLQNCLYALSHVSSNKWPGIVVWDKTGRFIRYVENSTGILHIFPGESDYVFAASFYDSSGDSTDKISLLPVDNRNTASAFEIDFENTAFSKAGDNESTEINISSITGISTYTSGIAHTNYLLTDRGSNRNSGANAYPEECLFLQNYANKTFLKCYKYGVDADSTNEYYKTVQPLKCWV